MPRGRAAQYDSLREQILLQATRLFAQQGYPGTSMSAIATACGVSKATLYHYVRDKDQLLVEITAAHIDRLRALVAEVSARPLAADAMLDELIRCFVIEYEDSRHKHRVLTEDVRFLSPADRRRIEAGEREVVAAFTQVISRIRPDLEPTLLGKPLAMLLFGMMNWMFTWLRADGPLSHRDMAPIVSELFIGGLLAVQSATLSEKQPRRSTPDPVNLPATPAPRRRRPATAPALTQAITEGDRQ